jgi:hypothetical protein
MKHQYLGPAAAGFTEKLHEMQPARYGAADTEINAFGSPEVRETVPDQSVVCILVERQVFWREGIARVMRLVAMREIRRGAVGFDAGRIGRVPGLDRKAPNTGADELHIDVVFFRALRGL